MSVQEASCCRTSWSPSMMTALYVLDSKLVSRINLSKGSCNSSKWCFTAFKVTNNAGSTAHDACVQRDNVVKALAQASYTTIPPMMSALLDQRSRSFALLSAFVGKLEPAKNACKAGRLFNQQCAAHFFHRTNLVFWTLLYFSSRFATSPDGVHMGPCAMW